ncbi:hypothetical protein M084_5005, partial [Bacteroides fragilis str. 3988 T1]
PLHYFCDILNKSIYTLVLSLYKFIYLWLKTNMYHE